MMLNDEPAQLSLSAADESSAPWLPEDDAVPAAFDGPGVSITPILAAASRV